MNVEILEKKISVKVLVESESNEGAYYRVNLDEEKYTCTCPDFVNRPHHYCKHIMEVKERIGLMR